MKKNQIKPPMKPRSNSSSKVSQEKQLTQIMDCLNSISAKIDLNIDLDNKVIEQLKLLEKYQEKKFDEMSQLLQQMNVSNGGKFTNPLIIPVENESPNIKTNISMNMKDININDDDKKNN